MQLITVMRIEYATIAIMTIGVIAIIMRVKIVFPKNNKGVKSSAVKFNSRLYNGENSQKQIISVNDTNTEFVIDTGAECRQGFEP